MFEKSREEKFYLGIFLLFLFHTLIVCEAVGNVKRIYLVGLFLSAMYRDILLIISS